MGRFFLLALRLSLAALLFAPAPALAFLDFGGWVTNVPGAPGSIMSAGALPSFPPYGVDSFWYPVGKGCLNGVEEVNLRSPSTGLQSPPVLLQFIGAYTYQAGSSRFPNQALIGKYIPAMVCMTNYVFWLPCGPGVLCPEVIATPFFTAPLIIFNGSSAAPAI
ncbi:MAG: hypothetical protein AAB699_00365 [Patescibacteria group bacterium]